MDKKIVIYEKREKTKSLIFSTENPVSLNFWHFLRFLTAFYS